MVHLFDENTWFVETLGAIPRRKPRNGVISTATETDSRAKERRTTTIKGHGVVRGLPEGPFPVWRLLVGPVLWKWFKHKALLHRWDDILTAVPTDLCPPIGPVVSLAAPHTSALAIFTNRHHAHWAIEAGPPVPQVVLDSALLARLLRDASKGVRVATCIFRVGDRLQELRGGAHEDGSEGLVPIRDGVGPKILLGLEPETTVGGKRR